MISRILLILSFCFTAVLTQGEILGDKDTINFKRTVDNAGQPLEFTFERDIYVTVTRSEWYWAEVPYYEEETYTEYEWVSNYQTVCDDKGENCEYKDMGGYQWVTKTRTITKYKTEYICCNYWDEEVYDHTWSVPVQVNFPTDAVLNSNEEETLTFVLAGTERKPKVELKQKKAIYYYVIVSSKVEAGKMVLTLATKPYLTEKDVGAKSIGNASIEFLDQAAEITVADEVTHLRVQSAYILKITEKGAAQPIAETSEITRSGNNIKAVIPVTLDLTKDYVVDLAVQRTGVVLTKPVTFAVQKKVKAESVDLGKLKDAKRITSFSLKYATEKLLLRFRDRTDDFKTVKSKYTVKISTLTKAGDTNPLELAVFNFDRKGRTLDSDSRFLISFKEDLKLPIETLKALSKGKLLQVEITTVRQSKRFEADVTLNQKIPLTVGK